MDVGHGVLGLPGRAGLGDGLPFGHVRATAHEERAEVCQRCLVAVGGADRDREAVRWHLTGERHLARCRSPHHACAVERDVDAAVLTAGVGVVADHVSTKNRAVGRPRPRERVGHRYEQPGEGREGGSDDSRCPSR
jgi:hypothetical protein